jgi:anti-anti-sigma factor
MQIREERTGDVTIISIDDHLDTAAAPLLEQKLTQLIDNKNRRLMIDCGNLAYVNSAGLKVFLLTAKRIEALGGQFLLAALGPNVLTVFKMIGFDKIIKTVASREEGLRALGVTTQT